jgi:hypothetical protein
VSVKRLKSEVHVLRKQLCKDVRPRTPGLDRNASLPRSPQKRNMTVSELGDSILLVHEPGLTCVSDYSSSIRVVSRSRPSRPVMGSAS